MMKVVYVKDAEPWRDGLAILSFGIWPFKSMAVYSKARIGVWRNDVSGYAARDDVVKAIEAALKKQARGK